MESRVLVLFLSLTLVVGTLTGCGRDQLVRTDDGAHPPVIEPDVERREIEPARIDTEDFEVGIFAGQISVEDFGVALEQFGSVPFAAQGRASEARASEVRESMRAPAAHASERAQAKLSERAPARP